MVVFEFMNLSVVLPRDEYVLYERKRQIAFARFAKADSRRKLEIRICFFVALLKPVVGDSEIRETEKISIRVSGEIFHGEGAFSAYRVKTAIAVEISIKILNIACGKRGDFTRKYKK